MDQMIGSGCGLQASSILNINDWSQIFLCPGQPLCRAEPGEYKAYGCSLKIGLRTETDRICSAELKSSA